ncbi:BgTH12-04241, partial [Blumeria graminis f. sp. triticale]
VHHVFCEEKSRPEGGNLIQLRSYSDPQSFNRQIPQSITIGHFIKRHPDYISRAKFISLSLNPISHSFNFITKMLYGMISGGLPFDPHVDISSLAGKIVFITGGNAGIGLETILELASHHPAHIYIAARNASSAEAAIAVIHTAFPSATVTYLSCDLTDLDSVTACARSFVERENRLDLLILNAGIMATPAATTVQGYEIQFGTNHVGHFLLTKLLRPTLCETAKLPGTDVRVVSVASIAHLFAPWAGIVFAELKTDMKRWLTAQRYGQSKLANILFIKELARQFDEDKTGVLAVAVHPGVVDTGLYASVDKWPVLGFLLKLIKRAGGMFLTSRQGAMTQLWALTAARAELGVDANHSAGKVVSGDYYTPVGMAGQGNKTTKDAGLAKRLWEWTDEEVKQYVL